MHVEDVTDIVTEVATYSAGLSNNGKVGNLVRSLLPEVCPMKKHVRRIASRFFYAVDKLGSNSNNFNSDVIEFYTESFDEVHDKASAEERILDECREYLCREFTLKELSIAQRDINRLYVKGTSLPVNSMTDEDEQINNRASIIIIPELDKRETRKISKYLDYQSRANKYKFMETFFYYLKLEQVNYADVISRNTHDQLYHEYKKNGFQSVIEKINAGDLLS